MSSAAAAVGVVDVAPEAVVDASAVDAVGDGTVGVVLAVDAVEIVGVTVADAAVCAVGAVSVAVVDVSAAAGLRTFPCDVASVADQQVNRFDYL